VVRQNRFFLFSGLSHVNPIHTLEQEAAARRCRQQETSCLLLPRVRRGTPEQEPDGATSLAPLQVELPPGAR
jgi:hypothetical protein